MLRVAVEDVGVGLILLAGVHPHDVLLDVRAVEHAVFAQALAVLHDHLRARRGRARLARRSRRSSGPCRTRTRRASAR